MTGPSFEWDGIKPWIVAAAAGMVLVPGGIALIQQAGGDDDPSCAKWTPEPAWANAEGTSRSLLIRDAPGQMGQESVTHVAVNQSGLGAKQDNETMTTYRVEGAGFETLASFEMANSSARAAVEDEPGFGRSHHASQARLTDVSLLDGLITADQIEPHAQTNATADDATYTSQGTSFSGLTVDGEELGSVAPWQMIDLSDEFGPGSRVMLYERIGSIHAPSKPVDDGWAADLDVNAVHIFLHDVDEATGDAQSLDLIVGRASGHSDFPMRPPCGPIQHVTASGTTLNTTLPPEQPLATGHAEIPFTGGDETTHVANGSLAGNTVGAVETRAHGAWEEDRSWARTVTTAGSVCLLDRAEGCLVEADALKVEASSTAPAGAPASSEASVELVNVTVAGRDVCATPADGGCSPPPDMRVALPGGGEVIFNEQVQEDPDPTDCRTHREVIAVHVIPADGEHETVLGHAESGAVYC